jgi:hypothetical protein
MKKKPSSKKNQSNDNNEPQSNESKPTQESKRSWVIIVPYFYSRGKTSTILV